MADCDQAGRRDCDETTERREPVIGNQRPAIPSRTLILRFTNRLCKCKKGVSSVRNWGSFLHLQYGARLPNVRVPYRFM